GVAEIKRHQYKNGRHQNRHIGPRTGIPEKDAGEDGDAYHFSHIQGITEIHGPPKETRLNFKLKITYLTPLVHQAKSVMKRRISKHPSFSAAWTAAANHRFGFGGHDFLIQTDLVFLHLHYNLLPAVFLVPQNANSHKREVGN